MMNGICPLRAMRLIMGLGGIDLISHEQAKVQIRLNDFIAEPNAEVRLQAKSY